MTEIQRIRKAINWLLYKGVAENDRELSEIMGYTKSSFSQIVNGRVLYQTSLQRNSVDLMKI